MAVFVQGSMMNSLGCFRGLLGGGDARWGFEGWIGVAQTKREMRENPRRNKSHCQTRSSRAPVEGASQLLAEVGGLNARGQQRWPPLRSPRARGNSPLALEVAPPSPLGGHAPLAAQWREELQGEESTTKRDGFGSPDCTLFLHWAPLGHGGHRPSKAHALPLSPSIPTMSPWGSPDPSWGSGPVL